MRGVAVPGTHEPGFSEPTLIERAIPGSVRAAAQQHGVETKGYRSFTFGECSVLLAREPAGVNGERLWHLSVSHPHRHPTWDEIKTVRYRLLSDGLCFGMLLPPSEYYVNVPQQDHVFHLWEVNDPREPWSAG